MRVEAIMECTDNGYYSIVCDAKIGNFCLGGFGKSAEAAKEDFMDVVREAQEEYVSKHGSLPEEFQKVDVEYKYDLQSFFNNFDWINITKFAEEVGINPSKMRQYKVGSAFASEKTREKIQAAVRRMSAELSSASL